MLTYLKYTCCVRFSWSISFDASLLQQQYASLMSELQHAFRAKKPTTDSPVSSTAESTTLEDAASSCSQRFTRELEEALQVCKPQSEHGLSGRWNYPWRVPPFVIEPIESMNTTLA